MFKIQLLNAKVRQILVFSMILALSLTTVSCGVSSYQDPSTNVPQSQQPTSQPAPQASQTPVADGRYPVQQVSYDDANGEYSVFLLNTAPGAPSVYRTTNLPMARLTPEEASSGQGNYLNVEQGQPALHLTEDFRIEYIHNVAETVTNPQTGQPETVIVRQEPSFWTPFAGALAGQALGSLLFRPQYYMPPVYQPGVVLTGYGGYGGTYGQAVQRYQTRHQAPPAEVRNRQTFRTARRNSPGFGSATRRNPQVRDRSTGSGYGSTDLRRSNNRRINPGGSYRPRSGFGSGRSRSFGRRR